MIVFNGTKRIGTQSFLVFINEDGAEVQIPVDEKIQLMFLHYFDRLSPGIKPVDKTNKNG